MANSQHIKWLLEGEHDWNAIRKCQTFNPDFTSSDIYEDFRRSAQLDQNGRVRLNGYDLAGADFSGAALRNVDLMETNLRGAKLGVRSLTGTRFFQTDLTEAEFGSWFFDGIEFTLATLKDTDLTNANLTGADLAQSQVWEARLFEEEDTQANSSPLTCANKSIASVAELIEQCEMISDQDENLTLFFRGERDSRWKLYPSVMRPTRDKEFKLRPREGEMLRELISKRPEDFRGMTSALEQLVIANIMG